MIIVEIVLNYIITTINIFFTHALLFGCVNQTLPKLKIKFI